MDIFKLLTMIGGLSLFLYGMNLMGSGLSKMAGGKLERILEKLTSKRILAVLLGAGVTAVIQSSSATTVMAVGFVNSGIMKLSQAVGIIIGANIGTTITSWMLSLTGISGSTFWLKLLKPSSFSPVISLIGIILIMSGKTETKKKNTGEILIGFGILMFGMETMSSSVSSLADNQSFVGLMTAFANPFLGMIIGAVLTAIIQSSSASIGILQALCSTGAISYAVALPIIMGQNIGTCVTSIISSTGASKNAKRAAMVHLYFNLIGTIIFMVGFYGINIVHPFGFLTNSANAAGIAGIHSLFNVGATIILYPFANLLVKLSEITIPDSVDLQNPKDNGKVSIDNRFLNSPAFAMELCRNKAAEMAVLVEEGINLSIESLENYDSKKNDRVKEIEELIDEYEDVLGSYLVKIASTSLSEKDSQSMSIILHGISDFERISDHALSIANYAQTINEKHLAFTDSAKKELNTLCSAVTDICRLTVSSFCQHEIATAKHVEPLERVIDYLAKVIKENHIVRLKEGLCSIDMGFVLENLLNDLSRISDHCSNVAIEMITILDNEYNTHEYFKAFSLQQQENFTMEYEALLNQYSIK